jgi:hypothetical protein
MLSLFNLGLLYLLKLVLFINILLSMLDVQAPCFPLFINILFTCTDVYLLFIFPLFSKSCILT